MSELGEWIDRMSRVFEYRMAAAALATGGQVQAALTLISGQPRCGRSASRGRRRSARTAAAGQAA